MKHLPNSVIAALLILALGLPVAKAQEVGVAPQMEEDREALEGIRDRYVELFNDQDLDGLAELYSDDVLFYDPRGQSHEGRDAVRELYRGLWDEGFTEAELETIEAEAWRDNGYAVGRYTYENEDAEALEGYYMVLFTRDGDEWRIHRVVANMTAEEEDERFAD